MSRASGMWARNVSFISVAHACQPCGHALSLARAHAGGTLAQDGINGARNVVNKRAYHAGA